MARIISVSKSKLTLKSLQNWNLAAALVQFAQGLVILFISHASTFSVSTNYLTIDPLATQNSGHPVLTDASKNIFTLNIVYLVAGFLFISAIAHLYVATSYRKNYEAGLKQQTNKVRWIEYGLSSALMLVVIGLISGVYDASTLVTIFVLTVVANLIILVMETKQQVVNSVSRINKVVASLSGIVACLVLAGYIVAANVYGSANIPKYVYWIYVSMFVVIVGFVVNMCLRQKKTGKWSDYLYAERNYIVLSVAVKSLLAWQVFAGILHR